MVLAFQPSPFFHLTVQNVHRFTLFRMKVPFCSFPSTHLRFSSFFSVVSAIVLLNVHANGLVSATENIDSVFIMRCFARCGHVNGTLKKIDENHSAL